LAFIRALLTHRQLFAKANFNKTVHGERREHLLHIKRFIRLDVVVEKCFHVVGMIEKRANSLVHQAFLEQMCRRLSLHFPLGTIHRKYTITK